MGGGGSLREIKLKHKISFLEPLIQELVSTFWIKKILFILKLGCFVYDIYLKTQTTELLFTYLMQQIISFVDQSQSRTQAVPQVKLFQRYAHTVWFKNKYSFGSKTIV